MKYRFLLHPLHHSYIAVDITALSPNLANLEANGSSVPFTRYKSWEDAQKRFLELGATPRSIADADKRLKDSGVAVLTI